ncbi:MAG: AMP-binding protein [Frankiaceae bacterium]|nr:AMP-binding protein [Frankiaceae bacterium]MBV9869839.1 AMP-binding protein [Frankiaceae bacterium]
MSPDTDPQVPSIPALLAATVDRDGDLVAVRDGEAVLTYADLDAATSSFAAALVHAGIEAGDRVSIWMPNGVRWIVAVLGLLRSGAVLVPVNTRFKGAEAADIVGRAKVKAIVTVTDFLDTDYLAMLDGSGRDLPDLTHRIVAAGDVPDHAVAWDDFVAAATDADRAEVDRRTQSLGPESPSDILFTSGTTGQPKGVVMTHGRTGQVARDWVAMTGLTAGDRYLMVNPYFHMFGFKAGILACITAGATMLPEPVFDPAAVLRRIGAEQVTVLPGPPTLYQSILDAPDRDAHDLSSLRVAVTGSADIPVQLIRRVQDELPFQLVISGYGLTEAGTATSTGPDDDAAAIATTVGTARPGFELRIDDGEILLRGPSVMSHYLDNPAATAEVLSADGWLRTGDLGVIDAAGRLQIVGRAKDMFIVGGFNAYPAEIENALLEHADVSAVAVIGIPDERLGEVGMAFVVPADGVDLSAEQLIAWSRDRMANYKVPRRIEVIDALPLNATGKVIKDELRERASRGR